MKREIVIYWAHIMKHFINVAYSDCATVHKSVNELSAEHSAKLSLGFYVTGT
jgi:hypothetical protein